MKKLLFIVLILSAISLKAQYGGYRALSLKAPAISGYATQSWVTSQNYATGTPWTSQGYITISALSGYSTDIHSNITALNAVSGTNTGDNAANSNYANDYRAANFVAGTNYLTPTGSASGLSNLPTAFPGFGTTGSLACVGNDSRLSDARTPLYQSTQAPSFATPLTFNYTSGANLSLTLTGAITINIHNIPDGASGTFLLKQNGTGGYSATINAYSDAGSTALTTVVIGSNTAINTTANKYSTVTYKRFATLCTLIYGKEN